MSELCGLGRKARERTDELHEQAARESIALVRAGDLDLAVIHDYEAPEDERLEITALLEDDFELVAADNHPLARRRRITLEQLSGEQWLFPRIIGGTASSYDRLMRSACAVAGFEPQILFEINDCQAAQGFVAAGMGIAVSPHLALHPLHPGVAARKLDHAPKRSVLAIRLRASVPTPAASAGLQCLCDAARRAA